MSEIITPEIVAEEVGIVVKESGVAQDSALTLHGSFQPLFAKARDIITQARGVVVTDETQKLQIKLSRELRLALRSIRVESDKKRKELKEDSVKRGRAIDGFHNILLHLVEPEEKRLEEQEKIAERMEQERKAKLRSEREDALRPFGVDTTFYQLAEMPESSFVQLLENSRLSFEAKQAAARKAEEERIAREKAEREEQERIRAENERLKKEAFEAAKREEERNKRAEAERKARAEREAAEKIERDRLAAERLAAQKKIDEERRLAEEKLAAEREKARKEREAAEAKAAQERRLAEETARIEREKREKLEAELRAQREKEEARKRDEAKKARLAAMAPDSEKIATYAKSVRAIPRPVASSLEAQGVVDQINEQIEKFAAWLEKKAAELKGGAS